MDSRLVFLILTSLLASFLWSPALASNGSQPEECCFKFFPKKIPLNRVKSYVSTRPECSKDGVVFITQKNNRICADPGISWVKWIISKLDERDIA
ncbi:C-C motif chemokine 36.1 [Denticeps clupeoides]|uniref:C-C motif chemokine 36.1 n=1 Tax=Denticeps clupeoides TaxID=299321 RepID=UPI0010A3AEBE|nr:C-C motif chemokine 3-like [Denticeps clupeoides]